MLTLSPLRYFSDKKPDADAIIEYLLLSKLKGYIIWWWVEVTSINSPTNSSNSAEEYVTVTVTNFGENSISDFDVSYQLNSENIVTETFTNTLNSNQSSDFTFNTTLNLSNLNSCQLSVFTSLNEDENISNDAITQSYSFIDYCSPSAGSCNLDGIKQFILNTINTVQALISKI